MLYQLSHTEPEDHWCTGSAPLSAAILTAQTHRALAEGNGQETKRCRAASVVTALTTFTDPHPVHQITNTPHASLEHTLGGEPGPGGDLATERGSDGQVVD
ncbi:hypothetical protein AAFF_G00160750 [Aldrovandia affinis]|uniref:Uncharacterized protein n=1 Tax=Aldrovandia affinis TaxID=143900 RepID=A0AAD7W8A8_9TELE|nr:hypothetical protein AAFF_G00160750 [Aldrovandia affinis]